METAVNCQEEGGIVEPSPITTKISTTEVDDLKEGDDHIRIESLQRDQRNIAAQVID
jgi:hypothetical protein